MRIGIDASRAFVEEPTGTERYSWEVISRIIALPEARKHQIILYSKSQIPNSKLQTISKFQNVKIQKIELPRLWTQVGLAARTWRDNLDVLWVPAHTLPVMRNPRIKSLVTIHGIEYEWLPAYENKMQRWYLPLSTKYAVLSANSIIAVSKFTATQLVSRLKADEKKIVVVHEGYVENNKYQISNDNSILIKLNLNKKHYLIFVGTVQPRKNLERLVEAFLKIPNSKSQNPIKLVIAGKMGWQCEGVQKLVDQSVGRVVLTGYISDAERQVLLQNALFYVQPSITEGFGLPILEAWEAGLAVVSSSGGALSEILNPKSEDPKNYKSKNIYGLLFDPYNVEDIEDKLGLMIKNSKLRRELEKKGQERLRDFSWDKAAERHFHY